MINWFYLLLALLMWAIAWPTLHKQQFMNLFTYRKSGAAVKTPVWFALSGGKVYVMTTAAAGKAKRIRNNPEVAIAPSDFRGRPKGRDIRAVAMRASPYDLRALGSNQINTLNTAQVAALTTDQIGALTSAQVDALTTAQIAGMTSSQLAAQGSTQFATIRCGAPRRGHGLVRAPADARSHRDDVDRRVRVDLQHDARLHVRRADAPVRGDRFDAQERGRALPRQRAQPFPCRAGADRGVDLGRHPGGVSAAGGPVHLRLSAVLRHGSAGTQPPGRWRAGGFSVRSRGWSRMQHSGEVT